MDLHDLGLQHLRNLVEAVVLDRKRVRGRFFLKYGATEAKSQPGFPKAAQALRFAADGYRTAEKLIAELPPSTLPRGQAI